MVVSKFQFLNSKKIINTVLLTLRKVDTFALLVINNVKLIKKIKLKTLQKRCSYS